MSSITLKISSLLIRTLSKPIANRIKAQAREHDKFRRICVSFAQSLHRLDMRLRLGLLQDSSAIDRQIAREAAEAQAKKAKLEIPTVKTEAQSKAEEAAAAKDKEKGTEKGKSSSHSKPRIRPLSEAKAIDSGANFISETFLFTVGLGLIVFESFRSRRKEASRRVDIADKLNELEERDREHARIVEELQKEVAELKTKAVGKPSWFQSHQNSTNGSSIFGKGNNTTASKPVNESSKPPSDMPSSPPSTSLPDMAKNKDSKTTSSSLKLIPKYSSPGPPTPTSLHDPDSEIR